MTSPISTVSSKTTDLTQHEVAKQDTSWNGRDVTEMEKALQPFANFGSWIVSQFNLSSSTAKPIEIDEEIKLLKTNLPLDLQAIVGSYIDSVEYIMDMIIKERKTHETNNGLVDLANSIDRLDLTNYEKYYWALNEIIPYFSKVKHFKVTSPSEEPSLPVSIIHNLNHLEELEYLDLSNTQLSTHRDIHHFRFITDKLKHLNVSKTNLEDWFFHILIQVGDHGNFKIRNLEYLNMNQTQIADKALEQTKSIVSLKHLEIESCNGVTDGGIGHLSEISSLEYLNMSGLNLVTDTGIEQISKCTKLEVLNVSGCSQLTSKALEFISNLKNLISLNISKCSLTQEGLVHIGKIENLEHLDISGCDISDDKLEILSSLKNLKTLDAYETSISQNSIALLKEKIPNLTVNYMATETEDTSSFLDIVHNVVDAVSNTAKMLFHNT